MSIIDNNVEKSPDKIALSESALKAKYRYWRIRIFYSIYLGYALFYFTRKSYTFAMPALIADLGFDKAELGFLGSLISISYGISKFLSGVISDRSSLRYFMGMGLLLTGVFNLFFGLSSSIWLFAIFLGLNGLFQGWGSPPCAKFLTNWYSRTERGRWWAIWNTSHNIGGALIPYMSAVVIQALGWRAAMHLPGLLAIVAGLFIINRLRDTPQSIGLPSIEKFRDDYPEGKEKEDYEKPKKLSSRESLIENVLKNKYIWILAISFFFVYVIRTAINDWMQLYLMEEKGYTLIVAASCVFWFEIGGIFGSLAAGALSDTVFGGRRGPVNILFTLGIIGTLFSMWGIASLNLVLISTLMFFFGFFIFGPQMLIGMAAAELVDKEAAGTATGFAGLFAYTGAACAGWPVGKVTQDFGWPGFFFLLSICGAVAAILLVPLWSKGARQTGLKQVT